METPTPPEGEELRRGYLLRAPLSWWLAWMLPALAYPGCCSAFRPTRFKLVTRPKSDSSNSYEYRGRIHQFDLNGV